MSSTLEMIKVMQAFTEGKAIEVKRVRDLPPGASPEWMPIPIYPTWNWAIFDYRIAPEPPKPKYRPYEGQELSRLIGVQVKDKETGAVRVCISVEKSGGELKIRPAGRGLINARKLFNEFVQLDGTPCGVKL